LWQIDLICSPVRRGVEAPLGISNCSVPNVVEPFSTSPEKSHKIILIDSVTAYSNSADKSSIAIERYATSEDLNPVSGSIPEPRASVTT
jgi:hypothetical protein